MDITMLIDFHVHVFPDNIAERAIDVLIKNIERAYDIDQKPNYDGTRDGLVESMAKNGVDLSVTMPIATSVKQTESINRFAEAITDGKKIISFAGIHPYQEDIDRALRDIKERGFKGIKLHPDYQDMFVDDERFIRLVKTAGELGLYTTIHAGKDVGYLPPNHGSVEHLRGLLNKVDASRVILAHMGGFWQWDEVEEYFVGKDVYFDTAVVSRFITPEQYRRMIINHGADRILFGSDMPWEKPEDTLAFLKKADLSDEETELITHKNAERILGV